MSDQAVNQAYDGLGDTFQFYLNIYHRNSIDNAGLPLKAIVDYARNYDNAFWDGQEMVLAMVITSSSRVSPLQLTSSVTN